MQDFGCPETFRARVLAYLTSAAAVACALCFSSRVIQKYGKPPFRGFPHLHRRAARIGHSTARIGHSTARNVTSGFS
eukprot:3490998-Rhodomonas_salina.2